MIHDRHIGIFDASRLSISLVGAGGIGAITAITLAKMGIQYLVFYDDDTVSQENMATQFHKLADLGASKVLGLKDTIRLFADDTEVSIEASRIGPADQLYGNIVISAVDSIQARKDIWEAVKNGSAGWYVDARMAAEEAHLFAVNMHNQADVDWYGEKIANEEDSRVFEGACTSKSTIFCGALSAALIGRTVRMIVTGITPPRYFVQNLINDFILAIPGENNAPRG